MYCHFYHGSMYSFYVMKSVYCQSAVPIYSWRDSNSSVQGKRTKNLIPEYYQILVGPILCLERNQFPSCQVLLTLERATNLRQHFHFLFNFSFRDWCLESMKNVSAFLTPEEIKGNADQGMLFHYYYYYYLKAICHILTG